MSGVSANGHHLWLSGRYDDVVYRFDTSSGEVNVVRGQAVARPGGVGAARALQPRAYRQPALKRRAGAHCL